MTAKGVNDLWLANIFERLALGGKLYLRTLKDVFAGSSVGSLMYSREKSRIALNALNNAVARCGDFAGCVIPTERGSLFPGSKRERALTRHFMVGSKCREGPAQDNAAMESFFSLLQKNVLDLYS